VGEVHATCVAARTCTQTRFADSACRNHLPFPSNRGPISLDLLKDPILDYFLHPIPFAIQSSSSTVTTPPTPTKTPISSDGVSSSDSPRHILFCCAIIPSLTPGTLPSERYCNGIADSSDGIEYHGSLFLVYYREILLGNGNRESCLPRGQKGRNDPGITRRRHRIGQKQSQILKRFPRYRFYREILPPTPRQIPSLALECW
jgi:hypothetical protein